MQQKQQVTQEGFAKLQEELKKLQLQDRPKAVERLAKARAMGDLFENSEYSAAREELGFLDSRIFEIEENLKLAEIVTKANNGNIVQLGATVIVSVNGQNQTFTIVGELESNVVEGKLSIKSPIGKALLGHHKGDQVPVDVPAGAVVYAIVEIK